ncbi:hypothetical protein SeLEV6574_g00006 [Synchytrium endobioticum]|uniref:Ribosomal protein L11 C-terminal domain-containing protein n=1 Tax=Synchytrium endobioticum TaxID=286115 RepID=A0A507DJF9_9FUNG|nr:hypothetical protein SeLEV6574_g00006 [Synchytrium endobioticum]
MAEPLLAPTPTERRARPDHDGTCPVVGGRRCTLAAILTHSAPGFTFGNSLHLLQIEPLYPSKLSRILSLSVIFIATILTIVITLLSHQNTVTASAQRNRYERKQQQYTQKNAAKRKWKLPKLRDGKKINSVGSVSLLVSSITGPGLVFVTVLYQQAGLVVPTLCFILVAIITSLTSLFLAEAVANFPRNERLERDVELSTLVRHFFGRRWEFCMQVVLYLSMQSLNISSIIISAQTLDQFLVTLAGQSCGVALSSPGGWYCVNTNSQANSPFENTYMLFTSGYLILIGMIIPLAMLRLADNIIVQLISMIVLKFIVLVWIISFLVRGPNTSLVPLFGNNFSNVAGTMVLNFAYVTTLPSWLGEKHADVSVPRTIWMSVGSSTSSDPQSSILMRLTTFIFPIVVLITSIPIYCIVIRYNLRQSGAVGPWTALLLAVLVPFLVVIPFQTGSFLNTFCNWSSLFFTSVANFIAPLLIYICLPYTTAYIQRTDFVALPYMHPVPQDISNGGPAVIDATDASPTVHNAIPTLTSALPSAIIPPAIDNSRGGLHHDHKTPSAYQEIMERHHLIDKPDASGNSYFASSVKSFRSPSSFWSFSEKPRLVLTRADALTAQEKLSPGFISIPSTHSAEVAPEDILTPQSAVTALTTSSLAPPQRSHTRSFASIKAGPVRGNPYAASFMSDSQAYSPLPRRPSLEAEAFEFEKGVLSWPYISMDALSVRRNSRSVASSKSGPVSAHSHNNIGMDTNNNTLGSFGPPSHPGREGFDFDSDDGEDSPPPFGQNQDGEGGETKAAAFRALPERFRRYSKLISGASLVISIILVVGTILAPPPSSDNHPSHPSSLHTKSCARMPPKADPNEIKTVVLRTTGGEIAGGSALAPKIGPLGLSPKKVGEDIAKATQDYKGLRITVKLIIQNRQAAIEVVPSASSLIIKALKEPPRDRKKEKNIKHNGNLGFNEVLEIARKMRNKSMAKEMRGTVREILGTCFSVGCTVDGQSPQDVSEKVASGEIDVPAK